MYDFKYLHINNIIDILIKTLFYCLFKLMKGKADYTSLESVNPFYNILLYMFSYELVIKVPLHELYQIIYVF